MSPIKISKILCHPSNLFYISAILLTCEVLGQVHKTRTYSTCNRQPYNGLPYYPCHNWMEDEKRCEQTDEEGNAITRFQDVRLTCVKRNVSGPYPHDLPACQKPCQSGQFWCEKQEKCLGCGHKCHCGENRTQCVYFNTNHNVHKYRCLDTKDFDDVINKGVYRICPNGMCFHKESNCLRGTNYDDTEDCDISVLEDTSLISRKLMIGLIILGALFFFTCCFILHAAHTCRRYKASQEEDDINIKMGTRKAESTLSWILSHYKLYFSGQMFQELLEKDQIKAGGQEINPIYGTSESRNEDEVVDYNEYYA